MVNQRKRNIVSKLCKCFTDYKQIIVVTLDNVSTNQIHAARKILSNGEHKGEMIIGKNVRIMYLRWDLGGLLNYQNNRNHG